MNPTKFSEEALPLYADRMPLERLIKYIAASSTTQGVGKISAIGRHAKGNNLFEQQALTPNRNSRGRLILKAENFRYKTGALRQPGKIRRRF
jgi:hypothetical protein